jgi:hypothetical protein
MEGIVAGLEIVSEGEDALSEEKLEVGPVAVK